MGWFSKKPDNTAPIQVMNDQWNMYFKWMGDSQEIPIMFFFDETYAEKQPDDYNEGVEVNCYYFTKDRRYMQENGFPLPEVNIELQKWEDALMQRIEAARIHAKCVVRIVGNGQKMYRFQTRDTEALLTVLRQWKSDVPYFADMKERTEQKWALYERALPKMAERMQMNDRHLIETLLANGCNEDELYPLDFTFTGPPDKLDIIQKDLEEEEFVTTIREANRLELQRPLPLDLKTIHQFTSYMLMASMANDCQYDGWGCKLN